MHRISTYSIIISLLFLPIVHQGQVSITAADMPTANSYFSYATAAVPGGVDPAESGANMTWDYSGLSPILTEIDTFLSVNETPFLFQFFDPVKKSSRKSNLKSCLTSPLVPEGK